MVRAPAAPWACFLGGDRLVLPAAFLVALLTLLEPFKIRAPDVEGIESIA